MGKLNLFKSSLCFLHVLVSPFKDLLLQLKQSQGCMRTIFLQVFTTLPRLKEHPQQHITLKNIENSTVNFICAKNMADHDTLVKHTASQQACNASAQIERTLKTNTSRRIVTSLDTDSTIICSENADSPIVVHHDGRPKPLCVTEDALGATATDEVIQDGHECQQATCQGNSLAVRDMLQLCQLLLPKITSRISVFAAAKLEPSSSGT